METINAVPNDVFERMYGLLTAMQQIGPFANPSVGATFDGFIQLMWTMRKLCVQIESNGMILTIDCSDGISIQSYNANDIGLADLAGRIHQCIA